MQYMGNSKIMRLNGIGINYSQNPTELAYQKKPHMLRQ